MTVPFDPSPQDAVDQFGKDIVDALARAHDAGVSSRSCYADLQYFAYQVLKVQLETAEKKLKDTSNDPT